MGIERLLISGLFGLFTPDEARIIFPDKETRIKGTIILGKSGGYSCNNKDEGYGCSEKQIELLNKERIPYERLK